MRVRQRSRRLFLVDSAPGLNAGWITADFRNMEFFPSESLEILDAAGAKKVWTPPTRTRRGACWISGDPETSVVKKFQEAPRCAVFIVDGSSFVTGEPNRSTMPTRGAGLRRGG